MEELKKSRQYKNSLFGYFFTYCGFDKNQKNQQLNLFIHIPGESPSKTLRFVCSIIRGPRLLPNLASRPL
jgi:hypothetical protein